MKRSAIETVLGAVVLLVAGIFFFVAYTGSDIKPTVGYQVQARFNAIDGLTVGSDARVGGVKVGTVTDLTIDQVTYQAVTTLTIQSRIKLPDDTQAVISSDGLLGGKYVRLEPGKSEQKLAEGGELTNTKDVVSLEELLGKVIFLVTDTGS